MEMVADLFSFDILASAAPGAAAAGDRSAMETVQIFFDTKIFFGEHLKPPFLRLTLQWKQLIVMMITTIVPR